MSHNHGANNDSKEIDRLRNEVEVLSMKLQESEKFKSHFLSNIRNALVNPFSSVIGLSGEIIKSELHDWKRVIKLAALIHSEAFDLDFQLNNIYCTAELEAGERHPDVCEVEIKDVIDSCIQSFDYMVKKKSINISVISKYQSDVFRTDPSVVSIVLRNLLHNAIKYSLKSSTITIEVHLDVSLKIVVMDSGIGMEQEKVNSAFERFSRGDSTISSDDSGHGLGLPIVRDLMDLMGGEIKVNSTPGMGSKFIIVLPESGENSFYPKGSIDDVSSDTFIF